LTGHVVLKFACPRCGYDQRGVIDSWTEACPLTGTCAECGLAFEWAELLGPTRRLPSWCVEYGLGTRSFLARWCRTLQMVQWPWTFWSTLRISHEARWGRVAVCLLLTAVALLLAFDVCYGVFLAGYAHQPTNLAPAFGIVYTPASWSEILTAAAVPGADIVILTTPWTVHTSGQLFQDYWMGLITPLVLALAHQMLCPAGFLLLPQSRRIAKVRWSHVFRITAYGALLPLPLLVLTWVKGALWGIGFWQPIPSLTVWSERLAWLLMLWYPFLLIVWWSTATGRYLRMAHSWGVGLAVVVLATLVLALPFGIVRLLTPIG